MPIDIGDRPTAALSANVLDRRFEAPAPNRKWVADFTYIRTGEGWLYVAAVIDLFSRRVVGWSMSAAMTAELVTDALLMAVWRRGRPRELLHHSDRGSQYTSEAFQRLMAEHGVTCSLSRSGNVWDNAAMESFFSSLKVERVARKTYRTRNQARADVFDYIERFYNGASEHPSVYVIEEKRLCWSGCDPAGYFGFWRARSVMDWAADVRQSGAREDPGTVGQRMDGFDLAGLRRQPQRLGRDLQELGGVAEVEPGLDPILRRPEHRDAVVRAHGGDAFAGPAITVAGLEAVAVENAGDQIVAGDEHQLTHGCDDVGRGAVALPAPALGQAHLAVGAADPVDNENDLGGRIVDIGDDLVDQRAHDALLEPRIGRRR